MVWDDQSSGQYYEIKGLQLKTGPLTPGKAVDVNLELELESQQPAMQGQFNLTANLNSRPAQQYFALEALRVNLKLTGEGLPKQGLDATLAANVYLDHAKGTLEAKDLSLTSGGLVLQAALQGQDLQAKPQLHGHPQAG